MAHGPAWLSLPDSVWLRILAPPQLWEHRDCRETVAQDRKAWLAHYGLLAAVTATSRRLRELILSPSAAHLWADICIGCPTAGLDASRVPGLQAHIERNAHRALCLSVFSGDVWERLHKVVAAATGLTRLELFGVSHSGVLDDVTCALAESGAQLQAAGLHDCILGPQLPPSVTELCLTRPTFRDANGWGWYQHRQEQDNPQSTPALVSWILHG